MPPACSWRAEDNRYKNSQAQTRLRKCIFSQYLDGLLLVRSRDLCTRLGGRVWRKGWLGVVLLRGLLSGVTAHGMCGLLCLFSFSSMRSGGVSVISLPGDVAFWSYSESLECRFCGGHFLLQSQGATEAQTEFSPLPFSIIRVF